jgi:hypothetical protein
VLSSTPYATNSHPFIDHENRGSGQRREETKLLRREVLYLVTLSVNEVRYMEHTGHRCRVKRQWGGE